MLDGNKVLILQGRRAGKAKRGCLDRTVQGSPDVDDSESAVEKLVCFFGKMVSHPLRGGLSGLVNVHSCDRGARGRGVLSANGVVEEEDSVATRHIVQDQLLNPVILLVICCYHETT